MAQVNIRVESVSDAEQQVGVPTQRKEDKGGGAKTTATSLFVHQAINTGKQILNYGVNNIGNFTGDYARQERVQNIVGTVSDLVGIGVAFAVNPIAGAISLFGVATKEVLNQVSIQVENRHQEIATNYLREMSGNSTKNGSRTGE